MLLVSAGCRFAENSCNVFHAIFIGHIRRDDTASLVLPNDYVTKAARLTVWTMCAYLLF